MTFAQWRGNGFDADFVAAELAKGIRPLEGGGLQYSGTAFFGEPLTLLETGVEFLESVSEADRARIIDRALESALRSDDYGSRALIRKINIATRDFVRSPESEYIVATSLSFGHFEDLTRTDRMGRRICVRQKLPQHLEEAHKESRRRSKNHVRGEYPEEVPSRDYTAAWIHVRGRSVSEAFQRALETLDLQRGIWNYALNRRFGARFPAPIQGPTNEVLTGPVYSLHHPDGTLATEFDWIDPQYVEHTPSHNFPSRWEEIHKDEEGIRLCLERSAYRTMLEDALRCYCRALDSDDLSSSFLNLWSLLETLTGIAPKDAHDKVVKRAAFIFADKEIKTHEQVLHHLRRYRNRYVHAGEGSAQTGAYLHQLRVYAETLLKFHLENSSNFSSLERTIRFLDLPSDVNDIQNIIQTQEQAAEKATEISSLAKEGLRFRGGS